MSPTNDRRRYIVTLSLLGAYSKWSLIIPDRSTHPLKSTFDYWPDKITTQVWCVICRCLKPSVSNRENMVTTSHTNLSDYTGTYCCPNYRSININYIISLCLRSLWPVDISRIRLKLKSCKALFAHIMYKSWRIFRKCFIGHIRPVWYKTKYHEYGSQNFGFQIWWPFVHKLPNSVANISSQFHHLVNTGLAVGSLVKWLPIKVAHTCKLQVQTIWVV